MTFIGDFIEVNVALVNIDESKDLIGYNVLDIFWNMFDSIPDTSELAEKLTTGNLVNFVPSVALVFTNTSTAKTAEVKSMSVNVNFFCSLIKRAASNVCGFSSNGGETIKSRNELGFSLVTVVLPSTTLNINSQFFYDKKHTPLLLKHYIIFLLICMLDSKLSILHQNLQPLKKLRSQKCKLCNARRFLKNT